MILNRYILKEFVKPFVFTVLIFSFVIQAGHLFDRLEVFIRNEVRVSVVALYMISMLPLWLIQALPICTLIAGVMTVGNMSQSGEVLCLRSGGISSGQILKPLFVIGLFLTLGTFVLGDTIMPRATFYGRTLYRTHVDKVGEQKPVWNDVIVLAKNKKRISAKKLDLKKNEMEIVTVEEFGNRFNLRQSLTAQKAEWNARNGWTFYDGVIRLFSQGGDEIIEEESFISAQLVLPENPGDLVPHQIAPEELTVEQLEYYIKKINDLGLPALKERVQYHLKFAFPFTHLLVLAIGIPIALKTTPTGGGRGQKGFGKMKSLAMAMVVGFSYLMLITAGQALGESRKVEPWVGVWIANVIFLVIGGFLLKKIE